MPVGYGGQIPLLRAISVVIAEEEMVEGGYLGTVLRLPLLAPDLADVILTGRPPEGHGLARSLGPFPIV
jgi:hypothetical protein